jgi:PAS domain S-box-containing protein
MSSFSRWLIGALTLAILAVIAGGAWFYHAEELQLQANAEKDLQSIAALKVRQLALWRAERLGDAAVIMKNPFFLQTVIQWLENPGDETASRITEWFRALQAHYHYSNVLLVDADGAIRLSITDTSDILHPETAAALSIALRNSRPVLTTLHRGPGNPVPHICVVAPLIQAASTGDRAEAHVQQRGAVILQVDAAHFLYPLIQFWPSASSSAETLLVRKEKDAALFLNDLRHRADTALKLRIPLSEKNVPAVMAIDGREGIVEGLDYRGVEVLSVLKPVPNSPWFMIAKIDKAEALAVWDLRSFLIVVTLLAVMIALIAIGGVIWQQRATTDYRKLYKQEAAFRKMEERYRATLLSLGEGVIVTDVDARIELMNRVAEELTGWRHEQAQERPVDEVFTLVNEHTREPVERPTTTAMQKGGVAEPAGETMLVARDGEERLIASSAAPIWDNDGKITGVVLVFRDQTQERLAQRLLVHEKEKARQYLDVAGTMLIALDTDGHVTMVNRKGCEVLGYRESDMLGKDWFRHFLPDDCVDRVNEIFSRIIAGDLKSTRSVEASVRTREGETRLVSWHNSILRDRDGTITGVISSGQDVTEQREMQWRLAESEKRYRVLFERSSEAILIEQPSGEVVTANQATAVLLGLEPGELTSVNMNDFFREPNERESFRTEIEAKGFVKGYPVILRKTDGEERQCVLSSSLWREGERSIIGYLTMIRDVTEPRRLEEQLRQAQKMESVGTLAGGIAHDFNNLLTVIQGYSEMLLLSKSRDHPDFTDLNAVSDAARKAAELVKQLLTFSRKVETHPRPVNLNHEVRTATKLLTRTIPKMIEMRFDLAENLHRINADPGQMEQVILNLVVNAKDAMPDGGVLTFKTGNITLDEEYCRTHLEASAGEHVYLTVQDTGHGMAQDVVQRIFEPFYSTKKPGQGTGLGLAMVYGIVTNHGGHITCSSEPGLGAAFTLYLPIGEEDALYDETKAEPAPPGGVETILIVDDEELIGKLAKKLLEPVGYTALVAKSGEEAVEVYQHRGGDIALVVLDVVMPGMGGHRAFEELRKIDGNVRVIFASGHSPEGLSHESTPPAAHGFMAKPFKRNELLRTVRQVLDA